MKRLVLCLVLCLFLPMTSLASQTLVVFGDSLAAGYGLPRSYAYPAQIESALRAAGHNVRVVNAGKSGETMQEGFERLSTVLPMEPDMMIIILGGNDLLRRIDPDITKRYLKKILELLQTKDIPVMVAGLKASYWRGPVFAYNYNSLFEDVTEEFGVSLYPNFLEGAYGVKGMMQADTIHPNAQGIEWVVTQTLPLVIELVEEARSR